MVVVHTSSWSTEDVVLPDADLKVVWRMLRGARARIVLYGHIHTPYQRKTDEDARPAFTIIDLGTTVTVEVRRVEWPSEQPAADYKAEGISPRFVGDKPGSFPVRSRPFIRVPMWR
jgi:hypothetical protein